jgi:hypothetical protein
MWQPLQIATVELLLSNRPSLDHESTLDGRRLARALSADSQRKPTPNGSSLTRRERTECPTVSVRIRLGEQKMNTQFSR